LGLAHILFISFQSLAAYCLPTF